MPTNRYEFPPGAKVLNDVWMNDDRDASLVDSFQLIHDLAFRTSTDSARGMKRYVLEVFEIECGKRSNQSHEFTLPQG